MLPIRSILRIYPIVVNKVKPKSLCTLTKSVQLNSNYSIIATVKSQQIDSVRHYAKGKQKEKARNKGVKFATYKLPDDQLIAIVNIEQYKTKLDKAVDALQSDYIKNLSLRSTTGSIETVKVKADGEEHELQDVAQIIRKNPKTIVINMIAFPQMIPAALQALQKSGLNVNPQQEGTTIFIPVPKVTKEHRTGLAKNAKSVFIRYRDLIKNIQNEFVRKVKDNTKISEDDNHAAQNQLIEIADSYVKQAEQIFETKQNELLNN